VLFDFHIDPEAGFDVYAGFVRKYMEQILTVLKNPCVGQRLRHPPSAHGSEIRWDEFCKFDLLGRCA